MNCTSPTVVIFLKPNIFPKKTFRLGKARSFYHSGDTTVWVRSQHDVSEVQDIGHTFQQQSISTSLWVIAWNYTETFIMSSLLWFHSFKNKSRQCHYLALQPAMLSTVASLFTVFPLQIHRSQLKVKKAGPVYFGRWSKFWKSNKSAIFSFWWLWCKENQESWTNRRTEKFLHEWGRTYKPHAWNNARTNQHLKNAFYSC